MEEMKKKFKVDGFILESMFDDMSGETEEAYSYRIERLHFILLCLLT